MNHKSLNASGLYCLILEQHVHGNHQIQFSLLQFKTMSDAVAAGLSKQSYDFLHLLDKSLGSTSAFNKQIDKSLQNAPVEL